MVWTRLTTFTITFPAWSTDSPRRPTKTQRMQRSNWKLRRMPWSFGLRTMLHDCSTADCQRTTCGSETQQVCEFECIIVYAALKLQQLLSFIDVNSMEIPKVPPESPERPPAPFAEILQTQFSLAMPSPKSTVTQSTNIERGAS